MSKIDLNAFDLNLIKAFDALMRTRSGDRGLLDVAAETSTYRNRC